MLFRMIIGITKHYRNRICPEGVAQKRVHLMTYIKPVNYETLHNRPSVLETHRSLPTHVGQ